MKPSTRTIFIMSLGLLIAKGVWADNIMTHAVLALPDDPRIEEPWSRTITSQQEWNDHFNQSLAYMQFPVGEAPTPMEIDFEQYQILSGGLGIKPSTGHYIAINEVKELDDRIWVHVLSVSPGANCSSGAMITYPSITLLVKKTDKPFVFTVSHLSEDCAE